MIHMTVTMEPEPLGRFDAIRDALLSRSIDFYPKVMVDGMPQLLTSDQIIDEFTKASDHWANLEGNDALDDALKLARESRFSARLDGRRSDRDAGF